MTEPRPGSIYTFPMKGGLRGACRVVRGPRAGESEYRGHVLVCATTWFGDAKTAASAAASPQAKRMLRATSRGPVLFWVRGAPPKTFRLAGAVVVKDDRARPCNSSAPWGIFPNVVRDHWRSVNEPAALERDRKRAVREGEGVFAQAVASLKRSDRIDLTGFVPLAKPKPERTPEEVLRGFIAAMNQWEKECARIDRTHRGSRASAVHMNGDALRAIFEEFCTPKERKYGRSGSYARPPEYDPRQEKIVAVREVGPRRVAIDTTRARFGDKLRYGLTKQGGSWLVDTVRMNGRPSIL